MRRAALIVAPLLAFVLVAGCSQDDDGSGKSSSTTSPGETADPDKPTASSTDQAAPCAAGKWAADNDVMFKAMSLDDDIPDDVDAKVEGTFSIDLSPEGTVDGLWDMTLLASNAEHEAQQVVNVTFRGTWFGTDSNIKLTITEGEGGTTTTLDGQAETEDAVFDRNQLWTATCSGSTLTATVSGLELPFKRQ